MIAMKRLVAYKNTVAVSNHGKPTLFLNGFMAKGNLYYEYCARLLNNKPMYSVICRDAFDSYGLIDTEDFEKSFEFFCELAIALKGVSYAENFAKTKQLIQTKINTLREQTQDMTIKKKPLFLGDSDFPVG